MNSAIAISYSTREVVIAPANAWDIFFLAGEIATGASAGNFSPAFHTAGWKCKLALQAARAILAHTTIARFASRQFVVARIGSQPVGAILSKLSKEDNGKHILSIEYLVVSKPYRRLGIGAALLRHISVKDFGADLVHCFVAPASRQMKRLLRKEGYRRRTPISSVSSGKVSLWIPALWEKTLTGAGRPLAPSRTDRITSIASERAR